MKSRLVMVAIATIVAGGCMSCNTRTSDSASTSTKTVMFTCPDTTDLRSVENNADREFLIRYLSSSPKWRVHADGAIVADLRSQNHECLGGSGEEQVQIRIRFGAYEKTPPWLADALKNDQVVNCPAGSSSAVDLPLWEASDASEEIGSCVIISGNDVWIEVLEWSKDESRTETKQGIDAAMSEIRRVMGGARNVDSAEFWRELLPSGAVANQESLKVDRGDTGAIRIHGFANQGTQGTIIVRAFDSVSGDELQETKAVLRRSEYVGWCSDKTVYFPFECCYFPPDTGQERSVRFEAWFYPGSAQGQPLLSASQSGIKVVE